MSVMQTTPIDDTCCAYVGINTCSWLIKEAGTDWQPEWAQDEIHDESDKFAVGADSATISSSLASLASLALLASLASPSGLAIAGLQAGAAENV
jgi:hypothetical protein